jgi:catechol 2,3-dioxygenase-like lactoylglutathione lyase family enzyme
MGLVGVNHVATVSKDLDALIGFYETAFDARLLADIQVPHMPLPHVTGRHALIALGGPSFLHAWEAAEDADLHRFEGEIFARGRVDHFALQADSYATFERMRQRLVEAGASKGEVNDFGLMLSFSFEDPDGLWVEVCWWKDGLDPTAMDPGLLRDPIGDAPRTVNGTAG